MKYLSFLILGLFVVACHPVYSVPPGHKVCHRNSECHAGEYCGFIGVDTYPVCRK